MWPLIRNDSIQGSTDAMNTVPWICKSSECSGMLLPSETYDIKMSGSCGRL